MQTETNEVNRMNSNKIHVRIGRKYKDSFKSICDLVNGGCIDRSVVLSCKNDRIIETAQYVFEYTGDLETIDSSSDIGMFPSGATWFSGMRGGESDSAMGMWHNLLESVAANYHKEYSLVEYVEQSLTQTSEEIENYREMIRRVMTGLNYTVSGIEVASREESTEDIYALSMRVELFNGAGEPKPLLCKLYFRNLDGVLIPIDSEEAMGIDSYIGNIVSKRRASEQTMGITSQTEIVDNVLNAVSKMIAGEMRLGFVDSMVITNETDMRNFVNFLDNEPGDDVCLECRKLKVLGISHAQWVEPMFHVYIDNKKAFLAKIDVNDTVSMRCCCGSDDSSLIERNTVVCHSDQTGRVEKVSLDLESDNLGLSDEQLRMIREESAFADHFTPINCLETRRRGIECMRYICKPHALKFTVNDKACYKCADCPYPEVIYHDADGKPYYTPLLHFDAETLSVIEEKTETCRLCGRTYAKENIDENFYCQFCASSVESARKNKNSYFNENVYRRYSSMIPLSIRRKNLFGRKICFENSDRLIFFLGDKKYFFDKLKLTDTGRLEAPEER